MDFLYTMDIKVTVVGSLRKFIYDNKCYESTDIEAIENLEDEVLLSYLIGVVEAIAEDGLDEDYFDVEDFKQTMEAFLPQFQEISSNGVKNWMAELAQSLKNDSVAAAISKTSAPETSLNPSKQPIQAAAQATAGSAIVQYLEQHESAAASLTVSASASLPRDAAVASSGLRALGQDLVTGRCAVTNVSKLNALLPSAESLPPQETRESCEVQGRGKGRRRANSKTERSFISESTAQPTAVAEADDLAALLELFPGSCRLQAEACLRLERGDLEAAADRLATQQSTRPQSQARKKSADLEIPEDPSLRHKIMEKYGYLDAREGEVIHRPHLKPDRSKKMVRYIDSKIVNTKGQRFTDTKPPETDEMKKTYINLKPLKRYKKH